MKVIDTIYYSIILIVPLTLSSSYTYLSDISQLRTLNSQTSLGIR